ncbi:MAG: TRAP transporter fused permease subunit [Desulfarculus sp.]|jgi:TRAP transporter 4TM/12TM fusion protein|nr:MAG: TRAP transporter fused permease subunit [Desulfarculus sp.]
MSEAVPEAVNQEKLQELVQKEAKAGRSMTGFWRYLTAAMGIFMVAFYLYCAAEPVDTQYFLGLYVLLTYVMVFLNYPITTSSDSAFTALLDGLIPWFTLAVTAYFIVVMGAGEAAGKQLMRSTAFNVGFGAAALAAMLATFPLWRRPNPGRPSLMDLVLAALAVVVVGYFIKEYEALNYRMGSETPLDTAVAVVGLFVSIEVARRVLGWSMTIVGLLFIAYAFWGDLLANVPVLNVFAHTGFDIDRAMNHMFYKQEGVFGIMATVLVTYVILFIFFGSFLKSSGASRFFLDLPMALAGRTVGGPAKVAVIASGFFGSVSGSAIANTVSTGAFTIPLMKKAGFRPHVAGAIEPSASIGGMFMPPIMGAGGFIMAEMTRIPYVDIMLMAIFPAVIYFMSVYVMIHYEAKRYGLVGIQDPNAPTAWQILKREWYMSAPLVIIVVLMLLGYSPGMAAFWAVVGCSVIMLAFTAKDIFQGSQGGAADKVARTAGTFGKNVLSTMVDGANSTIIIGATVGVIGIIVGTIQLTGIGLKFSQIIIELSFGNLIVAIVLIGLASLVLGMGVPVTAAYLITIVLVIGVLPDMISRTLWGVTWNDLQVPLGSLGADDPQRFLITAKMAWAVLASHMLVYWFSQDSNITPPVCVAAYAGAAIAGSDPWKTGWTSFKFAKMLYVGPFLFALTPAFLLGGPDHFVPWYDVILDMITIVLGTIAFGSLTMGYMLCPTSIVEWFIFALATLLLFFPQAFPLITGLKVHPTIVDLLGVALWVLVYFMQKFRIKRNPSLTLPITERRRLKERTA